MSDPAAHPASGGKSSLRAEYRILRRGLTGTERIREAEATVRCCLALLRRLAPPALASYLASRHELDLDGLHQEWWRSGAVVYVPRVSAPGAPAGPARRALGRAVPGTPGSRGHDPARSPAGALAPGPRAGVPGFRAAMRRPGNGRDRVRGCRASPA